MTSSDEVVSAVVKLAPPVAVSGGTVLGLTLNEWVLVATLAYTTIQIGLLIKDRIIKPWRDRRGRK